MSGGLGHNVDTIKKNGFEPKKYGRDKETDIDNILSEIRVVLKDRLQKGECIMRAMKFKTDQTFNLKQMGGGKGVRNVTIRNTGTTNLYLNDVKETVKPGSSFTIGSPFRISNDALEIGFDAPEAPANEAVIRYLVDNC